MNCGHDEVLDNMTLHPSAFPGKNLSSAVWHNSSIQLEAHAILHSLKKFHHYCFAKEVCVVMDHKPLELMINKDVATLSQLIQHIMLHVHQYSVHILYKPGADLYIVN